MVLFTQYKDLKVLFKTKTNKKYQINRQHLAELALTSKTKSYLCCAVSVKPAVLPGAVQDP